MSEVIKAAQEIASVLKECPNIAKEVKNSFDTEAELIETLGLKIQDVNTYSNDDLVKELQTRNVTLGYITKQWFRWWATPHGN